MFFTVSFGISSTKCSTIHNSINSLMLVLQRCSCNKNCVIYGMFKEVFLKKNQTMRRANSNISSSRICFSGMKIVPSSYVKYVNEWGGEMWERIVLKEDLLTLPSVSPRCWYTIGNVTSFDLYQMKQYIKINQTAMSNFLVACCVPSLCCEYIEN